MRTTDFGKRVRMHDGRLGVIVGYSSSLGAYSIAVQGCNDESYCILEWRNDFTFMTDAIDRHKKYLAERIDGFNQRIDDTPDKVMNACFVGWRDATEVALKELEDVTKEDIL